MDDTTDGTTDVSPANREIGAFTPTGEAVIRVAHYHRDGSPEGRHRIELADAWDGATRAVLDADMDEWAIIGRYNSLIEPYTGADGQPLTGGA